MNSDQVFDAIEEIAAISSRTQKETLVEKYLADPNFGYALRMAYDPFITFGVKASKVKGEGESLFSNQHLATGGRAITDLLRDLGQRGLTGNAAKTAVELAMKAMTPKSAELLARIINKDLRAGFTDGTINRAAPGTIPIFDVMLAHKYEEKRIKEFPVAVEPKLDGLRVMILVKNGQAKFFSRTGKPFASLDHLSAPVVAMVMNALARVTPKSADPLRAPYNEWLRVQSPGAGYGALAIDAEVLAGAFNKTTGDVRRKSEEATDAVLNIFDCIPYDVMIGAAREWHVTYLERRRFAQFVVAATDSPQIRLTPVALAKSHAEIADIYAKHRADGYEGAMVKPLKGIYSKKRSHAWLKMKNEETEDLRVVGAFEGEGKYEGSLGALVAERPHNGEIVYVSVGGGFSDAERPDIWRLWLDDARAAGVDWDRLDKKFWRTETFSPKGEELLPLLRALAGGVVGRLIEVEFHEVTPDGSLRHPRFVRFRDDKDKQEAA